MSAAYREAYLRMYGNTVTLNANVRVSRPDGTEVKPGDTVVSRSGTVAVFGWATRFNAVHELAKTGKVWVTFKVGDRTVCGEYHDHAFGVCVELLTPCYDAGDFMASLP